MAENKCPLCGKDVVEDETFCRDCQEIAQNSYPSQFFNNEEEGHSTSEIVIEPSTTTLEKENDIIVLAEEVEEKEVSDTNLTPYKSNKKSILFVIVGCILFLIVGGFAIYFVAENKKSEATEAAFWDSCIEKNTPLAYSKYLIQYPEGKFSEMAQAKILELRENERQEWATLRKSTDINAFFSFLTDHPNTPYAREIRHTMDSLSWVATSKENTAAAYLAYIENVKLENFAGEYRSLAQERYDYLSQLKTLEGEDLASIKKILTDFFKAMSSNKYKEMQKDMAPNLIDFFGTKNETKEVITKSIETDLKKKKIKSILYTIDTKSIEVIQDNKDICFTTLPIERQITYTDKKKKKESSKLTVNIELNGDKEIQSIYLKEE